MEPSWRQPDTTPMPASGERLCLTCDEAAVETGRLVCDPCLAAAHQAIREVKGRAVRHSDILAVRRRMG